MPDPAMPDDRLHPFRYDPFQQRAIEAIDRGGSVLVAAPTGAGKTVIADYVINKALGEGRDVIYTAPVKALSNQKFRDFAAREGERVGIMTGDVTISPRAPLLIMTTEIYRNTLLEHTVRWVIFDEIHYLDDPERGTVWEEALMFSPSSINILALSATIPNIDELAEWMRQVHGRPVEIISETHRPVPLHVLFQCQDKILANEQELKQVGFQNKDNWGERRLRMHRPRGRHGRHSRHHDDRGESRPNRMDTLVKHLAAADRLPGIFFTFGRRRAEDLAWEVSGLSLVNATEQAQLKTLYRELCERHSLQQHPSAQAMGQLIERGVAFHHAGMLPTLKEVVEQCFVSRLIKLIVTTETFALGINMPARSVVLDTLKKRLGTHVDLLRCRQYSQMAGRAGRRGPAAEGFAYLRVNPGTITFQEVQKVLHGKPEKVESRFNTSYATLLNLYRRHGRRVLDLFPQTFFYFQTTGARQASGLELMTRKLSLLEDGGFLGEAGLTDKGEFASWMYGYELLLSELHTQQLLELDPPSLAVLLVAVVFEPRPTLEMLRPSALTKRLEQLCEGPLEAIHRAEHRHHVSPRSKAPHFHLAAATEAWFHGSPFTRLERLCGVDEGEIVRYFRMSVQLLRQLIDSPAAKPALRKTAQTVLTRINRDVVDAEQQLRLG
jgi:superfamily II RNA helicase